MEHDWNKAMASKTLGPLVPDFASIILGTGYHTFQSRFGIHGLAKHAGPRLDLLAIIASRPKTGQFHRFMDACKEEFSEIYIWETWNPMLAKILRRYGFKECSRTERGETSELCLDYVEKHPFPHDLPPTRENRELGDRNSEMLKAIMKLHPTAKHVASTYECDKQKEYDVGMTMLFMKFSGGFRIK